MTRTAPLAAFSAITLSALGPGPAWGDRPLVSETADVIERGACQVEAAATAHRASGLPAAHERAAVFTCGVAFDTQPALAYGRRRSGGFREDTLILGAKTTLQAPEGARPGFGVAYSIGAFKEPALSWRREELKVVGLITMELSRGLLGHGNLGWSRSRSARQDTTTWSLGVETVGDFTMAADAYGDDRGRPSVSAGVGYTFGKGLSANAVLATLFESTRVHQFSIGAKLVF